MDRYLKNGFSMIEVLVSILVLAAGVIGAAGMQLAALRTTRQSAFQSAAVQLASELADKMRANDSQMKRADGANPFLALQYQAADGDPPASAKSCYATDCDGSELAEFDIYEWKKRVKAALPGGRAVVCRDAKPWDSSANSLTWDCTAGAVDGGSLVIKLGWYAKDEHGDANKDAVHQASPKIAFTVEPYVK